MTSGIVPLLSNYFYDPNHNYNLLLANMFTMFLINSFLTPIMWAFDFKYFLKKYNTLIYFFSPFIICKKLFFKDRFNN